MQITFFWGGGVHVFCSAAIERSAGASRRDEKWAIKATVRPVVMLRQLLSCAPCQALSITLLLLADIHAPITDYAWIIHRRRPGEKQDAAAKWPQVCVSESVCAPSQGRRKKESQNDLAQWNLYLSFCTQLEIICSCYRVHSVRACVKTCLKVCPQIPTISFRETYLFWEDI